MTDSKANDTQLPDPAEFAKTMADVAARSQRLLEGFVQRQRDPSTLRRADIGNADLGVFGKPFQAYLEQVVANPGKLMTAQIELWQDYMKLWQSMGEKLTGQSVQPVAEPLKGDRRFNDEEWQDNPVFDFIKQSYLLTAKYLSSVSQAVEGLDDKQAAQLEFYTQQFVDAMSPTNFASTNPAVLRETMSSGGENLVKGFSNLLEDLERGKGSLRIRMTDEARFELGENVAVTPGKVVFRNELMELLQYEPTTKKAYATPLLIIPPWINKFYILDLRPENSFIRWAVAQGHTVFVISWVNPDSSLAEKSFDDYLLQGPLAALDAIQSATGQPNANAVGYCLGGTLLAATLAYLAAKDDDRIKSATFFASMTDFSEPGDLGVFIDDSSIEMIDNMMQEKGYLDGSAMATTFNMLRANDLIWSFVINNYLMGKDPFPFDLLYWNSDSTRMPRAMHSDYLRNMYRDNLLREPGGISLDGEAIDLRKVAAPVYIVSTVDDHIAPWQSTYAATQLYSGPIRFVLGGSGHIAGIVNPPEAEKYCYWTAESLPPQPEAWFEQATRHPGSWWPDWMQWVSGTVGEKVPARVPGDQGLEALDDAPGVYVRIRDID
jgi:polyhydroxyalkanoate synthase